MYTFEQVVEQNEINIRQALKDYYAHTDRTYGADASDAFIQRLARDNAKSKMALRELFRKSPVWNEELGAIVINGTRTHDADAQTIRQLARSILQLAFAYGQITFSQMDLIIDFFSIKENREDNFFRDRAIAVMNEVAPGAYVEGRKLSKVFRSICKALGLVDETAGSDFQRKYAALADELVSKQIDFKLFVSINPAHFLTMSNPKDDDRGQTLTSCHSFNGDFSYNNGCSGYARDEVSFIVFTVDDPTDAETLNNRKTTRQIFAYNPGSGVLLQSRMYQKCGGLSGAEGEDSKLYRHLVQKEISELEDMPNLWTTKPSYEGDFKSLVEQGIGFGGYPDWIYNNFAGKVSVRSGATLPEPMGSEPVLIVGARGLCIDCGKETDEDDGLLCSDCGGSYHCDACGCTVHNEDDLIWVRDEYGNVVQVCEDCLDDHYLYCERCGEWHHENNVTCINGYYYCDDCRDSLFTCCEECGEWIDNGEVLVAYDCRGYEVRVCPDCVERYYAACDHCGELLRSDDLNAVHDDCGRIQYMCDYCVKRECEECSDCHEYVLKCDENMFVDPQTGEVKYYCPDCMPDHETEERIA